MEPGAKVRNKSKLHKLPKGFIIFCTVPALVLTIYFTIVPTIRALIQSFTTATALGGSATKFVGVQNYIDMFNDKHFIQALINTLKLMAVVPAVTLVISLLLAALLVQSRLKERGFYRTVFFFPSIVSMTVVGIVWSFVFHPTMGLLTTLMKAIGLGDFTQAWLGDSTTAIWCIAVALIWQAAGYYMVMHIAAMDGISPDVYEAATIDGAGGVTKFFRITLPLIKNIVGITFVLSLSGTINLSFVLSKVMTGGGPNGASRVLLQYMYDQGMGQANFGYSMAIAVFTLAISIALSMVSQKLTDQEG